MNDVLILNSLKNYPAKFACFTLLRDKHDLKWRFHSFKYISVNNERVGSLFWLQGWENTLAL